MKKLIHLFLLIPGLIFSQVQIGQDLDGMNADERFGNQVRLSANGDILAVSSFPVNNQGGEGITRIYRNVNNNWIQIGNDIIGDNSFDQLGFSLSLSSDGSFIVLGAPFNDNNGNNSGHVKVFQNINDNWIQIGDDIEGNGFNNQLGWSVSINDFGNVVVVGGYSGLIKVYQNDNGNWLQLGGDAGNVDVTSFNRKVKINFNGTIIALNEPDYSNFSPVGMYQFINNNWTLIGNIPDDLDNGLLGKSIDLSSDGTIIAVSALDEDFTGPELGYVRVYRNINNSWIQLGNDITNTINAVSFGWDVSINDYGNVLAVSEVGREINGDNSGNVRIYNLTNGIWNLVGNINGEGAADESGASIHLNSEGTVIAIGAPYNSENFNWAGHARVFDISALLSVDKQNEIGFVIFPNPAKDQFTIQLENSSDKIHVNIYNDLGQLVQTGKNTTINTSKLQSGLYMVEVETSKGRGIEKLIIE